MMKVLVTVSVRSEECLSVLWSLPGHWSVRYLLVSRVLGALQIAAPLLPPHPAC